MDELVSFFSAVDVLGCWMLMVNGEQGTHFVGIPGD